MLRDEPTRAAPPTPNAIPSPAGAVRPLIGRYVLGTACAAALLATLAVVTLTGTIGPPPWRSALAAALFAAAASCGVVGGSALARVLERWLAAAAHAQRSNAASEIS